MTVPFDRLGPGQVGRLVYQVIGRNGPIFNPSNISYLRPKELINKSYSSPSATLAGLAGLNLAGTVGALAISGVVLSEVRKVHRQLSIIDAQLSDLAVNLADVQARVQRIDTRVSESHLREALRHCLSASMSSDGIDLTRLVPLIQDIENLENTLEEGFLFSFGIRLSSDLRDQFQSLVELLCGIRRNVVCLHNRAVAFAPEKMVQFKRYDDYFAPQTIQCIAEAGIAAGRVEVAFEKFGDVFGQAVVDQFFVGRQKKREHFELLFIEEYYTPYIVALRSTPTTDMGYLLQSTLDSLKIDYWDDNAVRTAIDTLKLWMTESDASLIFRVATELKGIRDGYATVFYPELEQHQVVPLKSPVFSLQNVKG